MEESFHATHLPEEKVTDKHGNLIESALNHIAESTQHLDHQINIVIGISAATFLLSVSILEKEPKNLPLFFIMIFAGVSALTGLLAVHPPHFMRKRGQPESLLYRKKIESFSSPSEYEKAVIEAMTTSKKTREQYAIEVYNLCKYYYRPKRQLFHISRKLLFLGIAVSLAVFLFQVFTGEDIHLW